MSSFIMQLCARKCSEGGTGAFHITDSGNERLHYKEQELPSQPTNHITSSAVIP